FSNRFLSIFRGRHDFKPGLKAEESGQSRDDNRVIVGKQQADGILHAQSGTGAMGTVTLTKVPDGDVSTLNAPPSRRMRFLMELSPKWPSVGPGTFSGS